MDGGNDRHTDRQCETVYTRQFVGVAEGYKEGHLLLFKGLDALNKGDYFCDFLFILHTNPLQERGLI